MNQLETEVSTKNELSKEESERYNRHLVIPEVGMEGQLKLKNAKVLVIGAGGLGSPLGLYLASAGVGKLGIVDFDTVSYSNLQRQIIYNTDDVGKSKAETAKEKLNKINPDIEIEIYDIKLTKDNALDIIKDYDIITDGSDNFATRYLVNDACVLLGKPNVYASILRFEGQVSVFDSSTGPCYRCLYPVLPDAGTIPSCEEGGVLGVLPGIIGSIQANEAIKYIIGIGELLTGRLLMLDALKMKFRELKIEKNPDCPVCSENPLITELIDYELFCGVNSKNINNNKKMSEHTQWEITVEELKEKMDKGEKFFLLDVREPFEADIATLGGTMISIKTLPERVSEIESHKNEEVIVYCRSGSRSHYATEFLRDEAGFTNVKNLVGGVLAWSDIIDPTMEKY
jgi:molybdopterin/thiamine biosynthesis adenylyltransferase/rhodanese-related sulfurtransferase